MNPIELPHGNWLDPRSGLIKINYGNITFNFSLEELAEFLIMLQDVTISLQSCSEISSFHCNHCGNVSEKVVYITDDEIEN